MKIKSSKLKNQFVLFIGLILLASLSSAYAGPCTSNHWQPTFVHDNDNEDGPWYVMPNGNFTKLRIVNNRSWTEHACDLIGKYGVRNRTGYQGCKTYTRIQCGCKRGLSEINSTCANFLASHNRKLPALPYNEMPQDSRSSGLIGTGSQEVTTPGDVGHNVQVWQIASKYTSSGRYRVSMKHAAAGQRGSFYITAWADTNNNGIPDKEIGRSHLFVADYKGQWSSWEFSSNYRNVFVGNTWKQNNERIYYQMGGSLKGYNGLSRKVFYSRKFNNVPNQSTSPRYTNIRVQVY